LGVRYSGSTFRSHFSAAIFLPASALRAVLSAVGSAKAEASAEVDLSRRSFSEGGLQKYFQQNRRPAENSDF
jgi:hypothetical protein